MCREQHLCLLFAALLQVPITLWPTPQNLCRLNMEPAVLASQLCRSVHEGDMRLLQRLIQAGVHGDEDRAIRTRC